MNKPAGKRAGAGLAGDTGGGGESGESRKSDAIGAIGTTGVAGAAAAVLPRVLHVLRPLVRLLLHHGFTYQALATALKRVFLEEGRRELQRRGMPLTDSALTLLTGVHRRDVRTLTREEPAATAAAASRKAGGAAAQASNPAAPPASLAAEVVGRWMHARRYLDKAGHPMVLPRGAGERTSFDELVAGLSRDVRPRAVLDELVRLGVAEEVPEGVRLVAEGFAPRRGAGEMQALFAANAHDHLAAAVANLRGEANFLEQAVFVDEITEDSVRQLQQAGVAAWKVALREVMASAQQRFDADQALPAAARRQRARFGVYFYSEPEP